MFSISAMQSHAYIDRLVIVVEFGVGDEYRSRSRPGARDGHVCNPTPRRYVPSRCVAVPMAAVSRIQSQIALTLPA